MVYAAVGRLSHADQCLRPFCTCLDDDSSNPPQAMCTISDGCPVQSNVLGYCTWSRQEKTGEEGSEEGSDECDVESSLVRHGKSIVANCREQQNPVNSRYARVRSQCLADWSVSWSATCELWVISERDPQPCWDCGTQAKVTGSG